MPGDDHIGEPHPVVQWLEHSNGVWEVVGSIPDQVTPKTLKMVLDASLLSLSYPPNPLFLGP